MKLVLVMALRQFRSQWAAGELRVLWLAIVLAVAATTSVNFFTDRIKQALERQGSVLLGADALISADHPLQAAYRDHAEQLGLTVTVSAEFPSMALHGEQSQLAEIKAVGEGFPLRGALNIGSSTGESYAAHGIPPPGSVWIEPRLAHALNLQVGDHVNLGNREMRVDALLQRETSRGGDMFSLAPRLMMNMQDMASTGLVQFGSRVKYQLLLAGTIDQVQRYMEWVKPRLGRGEHLQDVSSARPEVRNALGKAHQFLSLAATVSVVLAMVAMFLAAYPYLQSSLDTYALMRCFGASRKLMNQILLSQTLMLALFGSVVGCGLGYLGQAGLSLLADRLFFETLPEPGFRPLVSGMALGFLTTFAVLWPSLQRLRNVAALHILRRDFSLQGTNIALYAPGLLLICLLVARHAGSAKLAAAVLGGFALLGLLIALAVLAFRKLMHWLPVGSGYVQLGLAAIKRRPHLFTAQVLGFSLGLSALVLLGLIRSDLLNNWQASLPADAPNRFLINIQPEQTASVQAFLRQNGVYHPDMHPMVRGRLVAINDKPINTQQYADERAKRLAEREFNLSWASRMQQDNRLLEGNWWTAQEQGQPLLSLEQGIAESLQVKLGDTLSFDIVGNRINLRIVSLRKVEWDSMNANFFALTPPGVLEQFPAIYLTSFYLPMERENMLNQLVQAFPNITVIDVAAIIGQVRDIMRKITNALQYVFGFSLVTGIAVLYAALIATRQERIRESALFRVLGASRMQLRTAALVEFAIIGLLASIAAVGIANGLAWYVSKELLDIPYSFNWQLSLLALTSGTLLVPASAWLVIRSYLKTPPRQILQSI